MITFEEDNEQQSEVTVTKLRQLLLERHLTIATAESCTGGSIAALLTSVAGSSDYVLGGVVSYANDVKHRILGVSEKDLDQFGAVSQPVVEQMAEGAAALLHADCAVATSGVAGPGGGTIEKPVGTVWIAATFHNNTVSHCYHFGEERRDNVRRACRSALRLLLDLLLIQKQNS